ncbi:hypothetical protein AGABI1DRAFT_115974 [Agaricus bisporus var. burnettii JB137-S8]|uniref:Uncharacterized protein n=1 Tax=Agaricus bisporus var. burnettii (strain JB137-S8 / ATCC MYA-4627 / FGSC 10392) TaxID=597362 RepID=K5WZG9_AGABU|nr:uncharacterized protein AGABI1DRAFT_115974 [Agaricus bisporus var. burnettii JB137-S8]EKM76228.1 hypothetical protein AGABI1DRAFT_115974 [Agaricus bisporus var. burnettii JB137-S8]
MANIGSAFLGDLQAQRIRQLASPSSSPPSSPPPHSSFSQVLSVPPPPPQDVLPPTPLTRINIDPELALELRIRWLEALIHGPDPGRKRKETVGTTLARLTEDVKKRLDAIVEPNDSLKKFIDTYDQHAQYLAPTFALSGVLDLEEEPGSSLSLYENMTPQELEAYLTELEPDIRAADGDMREIEALVHKGATGAGKLGDYEALKARLAKLIEEHEADVKLAGELEERVARVVEEHVTWVDALSELFVAWDDTVNSAAGRASRLERAAAGRERRGL